MLGGWASGGKYAFLGSMRAAAQLISYEIAQGLALVGVVMMAGSLSLTEIVDAQSGERQPVVHHPAVRRLHHLPGLRLRGDEPAAVRPAGGRRRARAGLHHRVRRRPLRRFFAAEYLNIIVVSALTATLFLGGWNVPFVDPPTWVDPIVVLVKTLALVFFFIWVRATLPRLRYDQLMSLGWKVFLPVATLNALVTAILVVLL